MGESSKIAWTNDTFNAWIGCTKIAPGCAHCYAEADMDIRRGMAKWGPNGTRNVTVEAYWKNPVRWNRAASEAKVRRRVFCSSLSDIFEEIGPDHVFRHKLPIIDEHGRRLGLHEIRRDLFQKLILNTPWLDWLLLTKRPENILRMVRASVNDDSEHSCGYCGDSFCPSDPLQACLGNVWLGTSVSDQETADRNIPELARCRRLSPVLFVSYEPALGPVDFSKWLGWSSQRQIDWVIVGGESGPRARPCEPCPWIRDTIDQCAAAGVACFVKQFGSHIVDGLSGTHRIRLKDSKGSDPDEWMKEYRVQQFPFFKEM